MSDQESCSTWVRLIAQVYKVAPLKCLRCPSTMKVIAVIIEPDEAKKILWHLVKIGRSPPGLGAPGWIRASYNLLSVSFVSAPGEY